jgi:uncharacterized protein DUF2325
MSIKLPGLHTALSVHGGILPAHAKPPVFTEPTQKSCAEPKRRRIWELTGNFHCSIIGTCLTTAELRQILIKILPGASKETDHELHGRAVLLAGKRDIGAKLLQKALDRRHRSAVTQFGRARSVDELKALRAGAVKRAEIPGGYWAILTHPDTTEDLARAVFGEVHMLSHLVGAANRADIRRLRDLEAENTELQAKVMRQQVHLREAIVTRDATIAKLQDMVANALASGEKKPESEVDQAERDTTALLIGDLRRRLESESAGRERIERRLDIALAERDEVRKHLAALERRERELQAELDAAEASIAQQVPLEQSEDAEVPANLAGSTLLYVGGRAGLVPQLRMLAERCGATLLHHDGGIDDRSGLLAAQVARADRVFFPVDCVSHNAVAIIKKTARNLGKPYIALRAAGLTTFVAALRTAAATALQSQVA